MRELLTTQRISLTTRRIYSLAAMILGFAVLHIPALIKAIMNDDIAIVAHMIVISISVPVTAVVLGTVTRSAVAGRIILLCTWYVYLSSS